MFNLKCCVKRHGRARLHDLEREIIAERSAGSLKELLQDLLGSFDHLWCEQGLRMHLHASDTAHTWCLPEL